MKTTLQRLTLPQLLERRLPALFDSNWIEDLFKGIDTTQSPYGTNNFPVHDIVEVRKEGKPVATKIKFALGGTGYNKENVQVQVVGDTLIVASSPIEQRTPNRQNPNSEYEEVSVYNGIAKRSFTQKFSLNDAVVDNKNVTAEFIDGTLIVTMPHKTTEEEKQIDYLVKIN
jgi:HSP20 family molecular chaperone IbpA